MDVFVKANELAQAILACPEYVALLAAGKKLAEDQKTEKMVREFLLTQAELAYAQSMGDKPIKKKLETMNRLAAIIKTRSGAVEYLAAYNAWQAKAGEIYQIVQNAMAEGMSILDH